MQIISRVTTKTLTDVVAGELIALPFYGASADIALVLAGNEPGGQVAVGVLQSGANAPRPPHFAHHVDDTPCVSFGTNFVIDLASPDNQFGFSCPNDNRPKPGEVVAEGDRLLMYFAPEQGDNGRRLQAGFYDLRALRLATINNHMQATTLRRWRLWADAADIVNPRAEPIMTFG